MRKMTSFGTVLPCNVGEGLREYDAIFCHQNGTPAQEKERCQLAQGTDGAPCPRTAVKRNFIIIKDQPQLTETGGRGAQRKTTETVVHLVKAGFH